MQTGIRIPAGVRKMVGGMIVLAMIVWRASAMAEPVLLEWTEPTAAGTLAFTTVYWCRGAGCTNWQSGQEFRRVNDDGNGGDVQSLTFDVPLVQGTLPVTLRVKFTATDTSNNETSGTIATHTFSE